VYSKLHPRTQVGLRRQPSPLSLVHLNERGKLLPQTRTSEAPTHLVASSLITRSALSRPGLALSRHPEFNTRGSINASIKLGRRSPAGLRVNEKHCHAHACKPNRNCDAAQTRTGLSEALDARDRACDDHAHAARSGVGVVARFDDRDPNWRSI
jgi:hypothetical protein